jgi:hypothetical protein
VGKFTPLTCPDGPGLLQDVVMLERYRAPGGWSLEIVHLTCTPDRHDGTWLRLRQYGAWTADVRTLAELAEWVPLREFEPDD